MVFTRRVNDMILQLELYMRAPVGIYADKNMVCLTIQEKIIDADKIHVYKMKTAGDEAEDVLRKRVNALRDVLDLIIGPRGDEYTELFCASTDQRKSVYSSVLNKFSNSGLPDDKAIEAYIDDLVDWTAQQERFDVRYSRNVQDICKQMYSLSRHFLAELFGSEDHKQLAAWIDSKAGTQLSESLTNTMVRRFRELWNAPGKHSVKTIYRTVDGKHE